MLKKLACIDFIDRERNLSEASEERFARQIAM
jgi:hypothetical protein